MLVTLLAAWAFVKAKWWIFVIALLAIWLIFFGGWALIQNRFFPPVPQVFDVDINGPRSVRANQESQFTAKVTGGTSPYDYDWNWGSGEALGVNAVKIKFPDSGTGTISVTAYDNNGASVSKDITITVRTALPTPTVNPLTPTVTRTPTIMPTPTNAPVATTAPAATATSLPTATPTQLSAVPAASTTPVNPTARPSGPVAGPSNLDSLPRYIVDSAPFGQWFHPIFDQGVYQSSGGNDGQWSWANTLNLGQSTGGRFKNFERNDGRFVFRMDKTQAHVEFAILTTSRWKDQFMQGKNFPFSVNIRTMEGTVINIKGNKSGSQGLSPRGNDLTIVLPDDSVTTFSFDVFDPNATHEVMIWVGPYDRSVNINTFDAR